MSRESLLARGEAEILNHLGDALLAAGATGDARERYRAALETATAIGAPREMAHAHQGIADTSPPDSTEGRHHAAEALRLCTDRGLE